MVVLVLGLTGFVVLLSSSRSTKEPLFFISDKKLSKSLRSFLGMKFLNSTKKVKKIFKKVTYYNVFFQF